MDTRTKGSRKPSGEGYPTPQQEKHLKKKMIGFLALALSIIILGWIVIWPYSLKSHKNKPGLWSQIQDDTQEILVSTRTTIDNFLKTLQVSENKNTPSNANGSEEAEIQELEQKVFPQFEENTNSQP